jgi:hypothetical protein
MGFRGREGREGGREGSVLLGSIFSLALTAQFLVELAHVLKQDGV